MPSAEGGELAVNLQRTQSRGKTIRLGLGVVVGHGELQKAVGMPCFQREPVPCAVESSQREQDKGLLELLCAGGGGGLPEHPCSFIGLVCCWGTQAEKENHLNLTLLNITEISRDKEKSSLAQGGVAEPHFKGPTHCRQYHSCSIFKKTGSFVIKVVLVTVDLL